MQCRHSVKKKSQMKKCIELSCKKYSIIRPLIHPSIHPLRHSIEVFILHLSLLEINNKVLTIVSGIHIVNYAIIRHKVKL
mmetsp:Transcript_4714/g.6921  ORF Transcript_4714/g.6921 Transcript_4714/m.6921 type:complete len:80 (+) Transcript_4714:133-372(+)